MRSVPMRFSTIVLKNAIRRPLRSILTALAIAVAVGAVVALVGISYGFERTFLDLYRGSGIGLIVVRAGSRQRMTSTLDERLGDQIRAIPGFRDVFGGLVDTVSFSDLGLYGVLVQGWTPETLAFDHLRITSGRALLRDDGKAVMPGTILAKNLGKGVGDTVSPYEGEDFRVGAERECKINVRPRCDRWMLGLDRWQCRLYRRVSRGDHFFRSLVLLVALGVVIAGPDHIDARRWRTSGTSAPGRCQDCN